MRKLKLEIEDLAVESFATGAGIDRSGTVKARSGEFEEIDEANEIGEIAITAPVPETRTCPIVTHCASCVNTCDACTNYSCPSGARICCA